jgi:hypothetical protein
MQLAVLLMITALVLPASAEIYRCGNSFSQTPCPGGEQITVKGSKPPTSAPAGGFSESAQKLSEQMEAERKALDRERCLNELANAESALMDVRLRRQRFMEIQAAWTAKGGHGSKSYANEKLAESQSLADEEAAVTGRVNRLRAKPECRQK